MQKKLEAVMEVKAKEDKRIAVMDDQEKMDANYQDNRDVMEALQDCCKKNKVPPRSVVEAALERFTIIDNYWRDKLLEIVQNYQDDGSVASGASGSTLQTLRDFLAHMSLEEPGVEQRNNTMVPTHFTANDDDDVSKLGMDSVYIQPNNHVQRAPMLSSFDEDASEHAFNEALSRLQMNARPDENDSCKSMCEIPKKQLEP